MYDPDHHDAQLVAMFEDRRLAESARHSLLSAGIPQDAIELIDQNGTTIDQPTDDRPGFWAAISRLFAPQDDAHELGNAVAHGQIMVVVRPESAAERKTAIEALEGYGPIDLDENSAGADRPSPAAPARDMVRIVEERMRVGQRDPATSGRVRFYVADKSEDRHRVELQEDDIVKRATRP